MSDNIDNKYQLTEEMVAELELIRNNPASIAEYSYSLLKRITDGKIDIPNPTNPFSYLMETSALQVASIHSANEIHYRKLYPKLAQTYDELYNHMYDKQYLGVFWTPGKASFEINLKYKELLKELDLVEGSIKQIIIPRGSVVTISDYVFTILHSIKIIKTKYGSLDIRYDLSNDDPIHILNTNLVKWDIVTLEDNEQYLRLKLDIFNIRLSINRESVNTSNGFTKTYSLTDKYCHCRVYHLNNGEIEEIPTTHSNEIYDPYKVTAKLNFLGNELRVIIPSIYSTNGLLGSTVWVEIYTTVGKVDDNISEYTEDNFAYKWNHLDNIKEDFKYVSPLEELSTPRIWATSLFTGGNNGETFEETRERVIHFSNYVKNPITYNQLATTLRVSGFDVDKARDGITDRIYYASRELPINQKDEMLSSIPCSIETVRISLEYLIENGQFTRDHNRRVTILPNSIFKLNENVITSTTGQNLGTISLVNTLSLDELKLKDVGKYLNEINELNYLYTPFYYVLDTSGYKFRINAYDLDNPEMFNQRYLENNESSQMNVSTDAFYISRYTESEDDDGYIIRLSTIVTENYKELEPENLFCQLIIKPSDEKQNVYLNGELVGYVPREREDENDDSPEEIEEYIWEFKLKTTWDLISDDNSLVINNLNMYTKEQRNYNIPLNGSFHIVHGVKDIYIEDYRKTDTDKLVSRLLLDTDDYSVISLERYDYHLGDHLKRLWTNGIAVQSETEYVRHERDIPRLYSHDVFSIDENGILEVEDDELVVLHKAGDPIFVDEIDKDGNVVLDPETNEPRKVQLYSARKGDVVLDEKGNPIVRQGRKTQYVIDLFMLDAVYLFSNSEIDSDYRSFISKTIKGWTTNDLEEIQDRLLENTRLFFYPKRNIGRNTILVDNNTKLTVPMRTSFNIVYYVDEGTLANSTVLNSITNSTKEVIVKHLAKENVSITNILAELRDNAGENIVSVTMDNFKHREREYTTYTSINNATRCSVKKVLKQLPDKSFKVVEDINVTFLLHDAILQS